MDLSGLTSLRELTAEHADEAARSVEALRAFLVRVAEIAEPEDGAPKVLIVFARLARGDIGWLEGDVTVEVSGNDDGTVLDLFKEEGWGIKERLAPQAKLRVPFDEFERAVEISAKRFTPLKAHFDARRPHRFVLSSVADVVVTANSAKPPPLVELDPNSLGTAPPPPLGFPQEPEPFELPPASEPDPFDDKTPSVTDTADLDTGFGAFADTPELDDPILAAAVVSPKKKAPEPPPTVPKPPESDKTGASPAPGPAKPKADPVHSRPTVRRMVAIKPEALRTGRKDPRREEDD